MTRAADRLGILVWSEIPDYWALHFDDPAVLAKAEQQLDRDDPPRPRQGLHHPLVRRQRDPQHPNRTLYLTTMADQARQLDPTRLVTAALLVRTEVPKGTTSSSTTHSARHSTSSAPTSTSAGTSKTPEAPTPPPGTIAYDKPLIMTEFGADAKAGLHGTAGTTRAGTEEYQADIYATRSPCSTRSPAPRHQPLDPDGLPLPTPPLPGFQDYFNRKGVISDQGQKKQAFFILQKAYKATPSAKPNSNTLIENEKECLKITTNVRPRAYSGCVILLSPNCGS